MNDMHEMSDGGQNYIAIELPVEGEFNVYCFVSGVCGEDELPDTIRVLLHPSDQHCSIQVQGRGIARLVAENKIKSPSLDYTYRIKGIRSLAALRQWVFGF